MPIENYVRIEGEEIVEVELGFDELVDAALDSGST